MIHPFQQWLCKLGSVSSKAEEGLKLKMIFLHSKIIQEPVVITLNFERPDAKQTVAEISFQLEFFLSGTLFPSHWLIVRHLSNSRKA